MGLALEKTGRIYYLHVRCANCVKDSRIDIFLPDGESIEREELTESAELSGISYQCDRCESVIGQIVGVVKGMEI